MTTAKSRSAAHRRVRANPKPAAAPAVARKATTFRLDPEVQAGLLLLARIGKRPLNKMVNEAVSAYVTERTAAAAVDLQRTLDGLKAWKAQDPGFESAIEAFVDAEARHASDDPVEGKPAGRAGPARRAVRDLLRG